MTNGGKVPLIPQLAAPAPARAESDAAALDNGWLADGELVDAAYGETMAAANIQTSLPPPAPEPSPPEWLMTIFEALGRFFEWSGPALKYALWVLAALLLLYFAYRLVPGFAAWVDRLRQRREPHEVGAIGIAEATAARARLADAEALARAGRFAEAVHLLLYRSIDDIAARRPGLVRPALTARDIAGAEGLPGTARTAFARIARAVEVSLFGGRPVDAAVWEECRQAYGALTVPQGWASA